MGCGLLRQWAQRGRAEPPADEIVEQVLHPRNLLPPEETVSHIVVMGMGESLANLTTW
jgi:23S rRNA (adenine2503-C2)-methyltransferase